MSFHRYDLMWGNYKSDKYKSKKILRAEISNILHLGKFSKAELKLIKDLVKEKGFKNHVGI